MRQILLYEFVTGGGLWGDRFGEAPSGSLLAEGTAMIRALAADFTALPGIHVRVLRDRRLANLEFPGCECFEVGSASEEVSVLQRLAARADGTILIAPEWAGELARRASLVLDAGGKLLSPNPVFIELAANKHHTAGYLWARGVSTPRGVLLGPGDSLPPDFIFPAVLKPVDGAGSQGVRLVESVESVTEFARIPLRLEQFCPGTAASVAALTGPAGNIILPACWQLLSDNGSFSYLGGRLPLPADLNNRARRLAEACLAVLPAAVGYIGFDLVLGADPSGAGDIVIEVNPRLTTSYVGLRALAQANLAEAWLAVAEGRGGELPFAAGPIEFRANGELLA